ncbi:MAG TPA: TolC family protein [Tepidisphaeraceae bacterium]|jgi:outer membrane protein TolC|nr:TolC family protein [Tepidisphaeraceae bacterium]
MRSRVCYPAAPVVAICLALGACQPYERRPLDLSSHADGLRTRSVADEGVLAFAERVRSAEAGPANAAFDSSDGLDLREAEIAALVLNPKLRAARLAARVAAVGAEHAGRWDDPQLEADVLRVLESVDEPWLAGAGIGFTIPLSGRLAVEQAQANAEALAALEEARLAEWEVLGELRAAWFEWSAAGRRAELYREYGEQLRRTGDAVERLAAAGEVQPLEARLLGIERRAQALEATAATARAREGRHRIARLLGVLPSAPLELHPALEAPELAISDVDDAQAVLAHPRVALARAEYEVAEERMRREVRKQYPDLTIGPVYEHEEGQSRLGLGLGLPLPVFNRNRRGIAEAAAERDAARAEAEAAYEAALHDAAELRLRLDAATARLRALRDEVAPLVDEQVREAEALVAAGEVDVSLLREMLSMALETKVQLLDAAAEEAMVRSQLRSHLRPWRTPVPAQSGDGR